MMTLDIRTFGTIFVVAGSLGCSSPESAQRIDSTTIAALTATGEPDLAEGDVSSVDITDHGPVNAVIYRGSASTQASSTLEQVRRKGVQPTVSVTRPKIRPELRGRSGSLDVIVLLHEDFQEVDLQQHKLPHLAPSETRGDASWAAKSVLIQQHIQSDTAARNRSQARLINLLQTKGATIGQTHWLVNAFSATIDAALLTDLEADSQVKEVSPTIGGGVLASDVITGRTAMNSDPYFNVGLTSGFIALLDTGIRASHTLLAGRTSWVRDCVDGLTNNCGTAGPGLTLNPADINDHGTGVAGIMSGTNNLGFNVRGTTAIAIDSFRVIATSGAVVYNAVDLGYSAALAGGDNVVNASLYCGSTVCADSANLAFDHGLVVVAAAGNSGGTPGNVIADPASGKKVLAVGAVDPITLAPASYSSTGPSALGQTKPDLLAVGGTSTNLLRRGSSAGDNALTDIGVGTSLASPFVTGGAGLMRRWLAQSGVFSSDAGQTYAMLLASGNSVSAVPQPSDDYTNGAGLLALPLGATIWGAKVTVTNATASDVTINVTTGATKLDVSIWWPEGSSAHNDVDMSLIRPDGSWAIISDSSGSVWEKSTHQFADPRNVENSLVCV